MVFLCLDVKWTVIRRDYVKGSNKKDDILSWVRFLRKLGVKQGIAVQRDNVNVMEVSDISPVQYIRKCACMIFFHWYIVKQHFSARALFI